MVSLGTMTLARERAIDLIELEDAHEATTQSMAKRLRLMLGQCVRVIEMVRDRSLMRLCLLALRAHVDAVKTSGADPAGGASALAAGGPASQTGSGDSKGVMLPFEREEELEQQCSELRRRVLHSASLSAQHSARQRERATKRVVFMALRIWARAEAAPRAVESATRAVAAERTVQARGEAEALRQVCVDRLFGVRSLGAVRVAFMHWREDARREAWGEIIRDKLEREVGEALEAAREEGQEKGREQGYAQGRAEGLEQGRAEGRVIGIAEARDEARAEALAEARAEARAEALAEGRAQAQAEASVVQAGGTAAATQMLALEERVHKLTVRLVAARCRVGEVSKTDGRWVTDVVGFP